MNSRIVVKLMFNKYAQVIINRLIHAVITNLHIQEANIQDWNEPTEGHWNEGEYAFDMMLVYYTIFSFVQVLSH